MAGATGIQPVVVSQVVTGFRFSENRSGLLLSAATFIQPLLEGSLALPGWIPGH